MYALVSFFVAVLAVVSARPRDANGDFKRQAAGGPNGCGNMSFGEPTGLISTPNFPSNYPDNMDCVYSIQPNTTSFNVSFHTCDCFLEDNPTCGWDYLQIGRNTSKLCGDKSGRNFSVSSNNGKAEIVFHSDGSVNLIGCQIAYGISIPVGQVKDLCPPSQISNSTTPGYNFSTPVFNDTTPSYNFSSPIFNGTTPSYNFSSPVFNDTTPSYNFSSPVFNGTTPSYNFSSPVFNSTTPSYNFSNPIFNTTTPSYNFSSPVFNVTVMPPTPGTNSSNASISDLLNELRFTEYRLESLFEQYRSLVWEIVNRLM